MYYVIKLNPFSCILRTDNLLKVEDCSMEIMEGPPNENKPRHKAW